MLKKFYIFALFFSLLTSCSDGATDLVKGHVRGAQYEGKHVYLTEVGSYTTVLDSALVTEQKFKLHLGDSVRLYNLVLRSSADDIYPVALPIVGGEGVVEAYLGEKIVTTGTPSNDALQDFLIASDQMFDKLINSKQTVEQVKSQFKSFLADQVKIHKNSIVSAYILLLFRDKFTEDELLELKDLIPTQFKSVLK